MSAARFLLIAALPVYAQELRIGVLSLFRPAAIRLTGVSVHAGAERWSGTVDLRASGNQVICRSGGRELRSQAVGVAGPANVEIPGKIRREYTGSVEVRARDGVLWTVVRVGLESAVAIVSASEMPRGPAEARKAQAIAARSYYKAGGRHTDFDFCDTTHCQLFQEPSRSNAAESTRGQALTYRGQLVRAMYFRSCGGVTNSAASVKLPFGGYPYFAVPCPGCARNPHLWEARLPEFIELDHSESQRLDLARRFGWNRIASNDYTVEHAMGGTVLRGKGHGHGVGLCQRGAAAMALAGHDFASILGHYYPQASLVR